MRTLFGVVSAFSFALGIASTSSAEIDASKLPVPASRQIDFTRDVKPILDLSCIRCHGPEKPKGGYRLDNRESALKGGNENVDIVSGKSAESPLIHYVAHLVPDMEMPPEGKGEPLNSEQIGILRAWIDQGVAWGNAPATNLFDITVGPTAGYTFVSGDSRKFREHYWRRDGADGGVENFELWGQRGADTIVSAKGHALLDDYKLSIEVTRRDFGFIRSGWEQSRKYYDDTGGFFPSPEDPRAPLSLGKDLFLDRGRAWIDFGLTLPNLPRMVLGYEYDYRRGEEATTAWSSDFNENDPRNLAPSTKHIDEKVHIIKFNLDTEFKGIAIEDRFRGEFYSLNNSYTNIAARNSVAQNASEEVRYFQGANSIRLEKQITDWFFTSAGYFYSKLDSQNSFANETTSGDTLYLASVPNIELTRESHVFNFNTLFGPFDGLTFHAGVQSDWTRQHGFGSGELNGIQYVRPPGSNFEINPATVLSDYDDNSVTEMAGLRYTKIPFTSLFADARLKQESLGQYDYDIQPTTSFLENPSYSSDITDVRVGFNTSPWERVSLTGHYRRYESESRYKTNDVPLPLGGYPGFLRWRDQTTDEVEAKLVVRINSWLKSTLAYQIVKTEYDVDTHPAYDIDPLTVYSAGGPLRAGTYDSHIYSVGFTATPLQRLALTTMFSYQDSSISTENAGYTPPYEGHVYSALLNALYIFNKSTDLSVTYSLSLADYSQPFVEANPPPTGIEYQQHALRAAISRRINKNVTTRLQYGFYRYNEPSSAHFNDYTAHSVFGTVICRLP